MEIITLQKQQIKAAFIVSLLIILAAMVLILQVLAHMVPEAEKEEGDFIIKADSVSNPASLIAGPSTNADSLISDPTASHVINEAALRRANRDYDAIDVEQDFSSAFSNIWAPDHQSVSADDFLVNITLDQRSGCGFKTKEAYLYGYFSVEMKFPANNNTAGVAVTFYTSNSDQYPSNHDEIDFEFLGATEGQPILVQTNVYGNGSTNVGREQRYHLWFDPSADFHHYSILWTPYHIVFGIDGIAVRELRNSAELGLQYPSKPMSVYATIWDASAWATEGGKYKIDFAHSPFVASYTNFVLNTCSPSKSTTTEEGKEEETERRAHDLPSSTFAAQKTQQLPAPKTGGSCTVLPAEDPSLQSEKSVANGLRWIRQNYMVYDYCEDSRRYPQLPPECKDDDRD